MNHRHEPSYRFTISHGWNEALGIRMGHATCACGEKIVQFGSRLRAWRIAADVQLGDVEGPEVFAPIVPAERRFEVTLRNGISPRGSMSRPFCSVTEARDFAITERPWNNTAAKIIDLWTGATVPLFGDRCVCCFCFDHETGRHEHIAAPCAAHPDRHWAPVVPFVTCAIPERVLSTQAAQPYADIAPLTDEEAQALVAAWLERL